MKKPARPIARACLATGACLGLFVLISLAAREAPLSAGAGAAGFAVPVLSTLPGALAMAKEEDAWDQKPVVYNRRNLGINLPWLDTHDGKEVVNWLNDKYAPALIDADLAAIQAMGVARVRTFCQLESLFHFRGGAFELDEGYARNLDDFLTRANGRGISVICVMGYGNYDGRPRDMDGNFRWDLITREDGQKAYADAYVKFVNRFRRHSNILMWEIHNEPYGTTTWAGAAKDAGVTYAHVHAYLVRAYKAIKPLAGGTPVGFSELQEEEQAKYRMFSSEANRREYVDDCTDVYSMHIYRASAAQMFDFRSLKGKPKWLVEVGGYNYLDLDLVEHPIPAANELYDPDRNFVATYPIMRKAINSGFELVMPWGFSANSGLVTHNPDGSHALQRLALFIQKQLATKR